MVCSNNLVMLCKHFKFSFIKLLILDKFQDFKKHTPPSCQLNDLDDLHRHELDINSDVLELNVDI